MQKVLIEFFDLFEKLRTLPLARDYDHEIPLLLNSKIVNIGAYRYSHVQKDVIERMAKHMLQVGIITPSTSPFASLVLILSKKDSS